MKTKEFIRQIKEFGLEVDEYRNKVSVENKKGLDYAFIREDISCILDVDYPGFYLLSRRDKKILFNLLVEYARTPIEERKEEKKYYIRHKHLSKNDNYLSFNIDDDIEDTDRWFFGDSCECEVDWYVTKFPLNALPSWAKEMLEQGHLVKEEVE